MSHTKILRAALESAKRAIGEHHAPNDCYATGPLTGDDYKDLVECPACKFLEDYEALAATAAPAQSTEPTITSVKMSAIEKTKALDAFILRAGFSYEWRNLESWGRRMAEHGVEQNAILTAQLAAMTAKRDVMQVRIRAATVWLEEHQVDVFRRGLYDAIAAAPAAVQGVLTEKDCLISRHLHEELELELAAAPAAVQGEPAVIRELLTLDELIELIEKSEWVDPETDRKQFDHLGFARAVENRVRAIFAAAPAAVPDAQPKPKFDQAEFDEMVRRGTAAWAGVDTKNIYGDAQPEQDQLDAARYRWLRDVGDSTYTAFANHPGYDAMQADRHIDAAIAQAKEGKT